jgi:ribosomal protein L29
MAVLAVAMFGGVSLAQMTPEEAAKRLAERQAQREAEKNKLVQIKAGDLEAMKAEIESLKKEVAALKQQVASTQNPANADAPVVIDPAEQMRVRAAPNLKFTTSIDVGASRQQLITYISMHKQHFRVGRDVRDAAAHQESMTVELWYTAETYEGTTAGNFGKIRNYRKEKKVMSSIEVVLVNDVIAQISGGKLDKSTEDLAVEAERESANQKK